MLSKYSITAIARSSMNVRTGSPHWISISLSASYGVAGLSRHGAGRCRLGLGGVLGAEGPPDAASRSARDGMRRLFDDRTMMVVGSVSATAGRLRFAAAGLQAFSGMWPVSLRTDIGPSSRTVRGHKKDNESAGTASGRVYLQALHCSEQ